MATRKRNVNTKARQIVRSATDKGYTYKEIAEICDVSTGSIKRWLATGRADASKIKKIEMEIGHVHLSCESVGDLLIDIYKSRKKRYRLKRIELKRVAGRSVLKSGFIDNVLMYLLDKGYYMIEAVEGDDDFFVIIRVRQVLKYVKHFLSEGEINKYFNDLADEIDDIDYDEE
ncbi:hypothetical protein KKHLCK_14835 [Candidatus Electrothrix laxa]